MWWHESVSLSVSVSRSCRRLWAPTVQCERTLITVLRTDTWVLDTLPVAADCLWRVNYTLTRIICWLTGAITGAQCAPRHGQFRDKTRHRVTSHPLRSWPLPWGTPVGRDLWTCGGLAVVVSTNCKWERRINGRICRPFTTKAALRVSLPWGRTKTTDSAPVLLITSSNQEFCRVFGVRGEVDCPDNSGIGCW